MQETQGTYDATLENPAAPAETPALETEEEEGAAAVPNLNSILAGDKALQSQYDKQVSKALQTAHTRWEKERHMSAEELAQAKARERAQELDKREQELRTRELRAQALQALSERGIPGELIGCVSLADNEAMEASLLKAEQAFRGAVDKAVREKMAGAVPKGSGQSAAGYMAQLRAAAGIKTK